MFANTSWKTTVIGLVLAVAMVVIPLIQTGTVELKDIVIAALLAIAGYLQKDKNVTGGDVSNKMTVKK